MNDDAAKLLDCRTPDCAQADAITLDAGSPYRSTPALVLDRSGRPQVAYQSRDGTRLMLATCHARRCVSTAVARMRGAGDGLAMTVDDRGRPTIAWVDDGGSLTGGDWALMITTPLNLGAHAAGTSWDRSTAGCWFTLFHAAPATGAGARARRRCPLGTLSVLSPHGGP
ncbi:hypothetical protein [Nonomuraea sp. GTA35]|uniref:hypothetical protein n=1 Tax=Nonomuraea sp. GTA35 TaxID=1676746 RepID=UPI0035C14D3A